MQQPSSYQGSNPVTMHRLQICLNTAQSILASVLRSSVPQTHQFDLVCLQVSTPFDERNFKDGGRREISSSLSGSKS